MRHAGRGLLVLALLLAAVGTAQAQTVRIGITSRTMDSLAVLLAQDRGLFKEEGVNAEVFVLGTSTRILPALVGGSIDVFDSTLFVVLLAIEKGEKVEIIGTPNKYAMFHLVTRADIKQAKDMKGKRVGSTGVGSGQYFSAIEFMEKQGMKFPGDYSFITIGGTPEIWRSLEAGAVDAGVLLFPFHIMAQQKGYNVLAALYRDASYPLTAMVVRSDWGRKNADLLVRYLKGLRRAMEFIYTRPQETVETAVKLVGLTPEMARLGWEEYSRIGQWQRDLVLPDEAVRTMLGFLVKSGEIKTAGEVGKYVNPDYVVRANAEFKPR